MKHTRKDYMSGEVSHGEYYAQFITKEVKRLVKSRIKSKRIMQSKNDFFNDIPLVEWDALSPSIRQYVGYALGVANGTGGVSLSDCVCVAKAAARMIKEEVSKMTPSELKYQVSQTGSHFFDRASLKVLW